MKSRLVDDQAAFFLPWTNGVRWCAFNSLRRSTPHAARRCRKVRVIHATSATTTVSATGSGHVHTLHHRTPIHRCRGQATARHRGERLCTKRHNVGPLQRNHARLSVL